MKNVLIIGIILALPLAAFAIIKKPVCIINNCDHPIRVTQRGHDRVTSSKVTQVESTKDAGTINIYKHAGIFAGKAKYGITIYNAKPGETYSITCNNKNVPNRYVLQSGIVCEQK